MIKKVKNIVVGIIIASILLFIVLKVSEFIILFLSKHLFYILMFAIFLFVIWKLGAFKYFSPDTTKKKKCHHKLTRDRVIIIVSILICVLFVLILLNTYRWEKDEPYIEYLSYDDFRFFRHERDRWTDTIWARNYASYAFFEYPDKEYAERVIDVFLDYNIGIKSGLFVGSFNYETTRARISPYKYPKYTIEYIIDSQYGCEEEARYNRILFTMIWDIITMTTVGLIIWFLKVYKDISDIKRRTKY